MSSSVKRRSSCEVTCLNVASRCCHLTVEAAIQARCSISHFGLFSVVLCKLSECQLRAVRVSRHFGREADIVCRCALMDAEYREQTFRLCQIRLDCCNAGRRLWTKFYRCKDLVFVRAVCTLFSIFDQAKLRALYQTCFAFPVPKV